MRSSEKINSKFDKLISSGFNKINEFLSEYPQIKEKYSQLDSEERIRMLTGVLEIAANTAPDSAVDIEWNAEINFNGNLEVSLLVEYSNGRSSCDYPDIDDLLRCEIKFEN